MRMNVQDLKNLNSKRCIHDVIPVLKICNVFYLDVIPEKIHLKRCVNFQK